LDGEERKKERKKRKVKVKNFSLFRKEKEKLEKKNFSKHFSRVQLPISEKYCLLYRIKKEKRNEA